MFAFLFLLMNYCKKIINPIEKRSCEIMRHNWMYNRYPYSTMEHYKEDLKKTNDALNYDTGNNFSFSDIAEFLDSVLDSEFDSYYYLLTYGPSLLFKSNETTTNITQNINLLYAKFVNESKQIRIINKNLANITNEMIQINETTTNITDKQVNMTTKIIHLSDKINSITKKITDIETSMNKTEAAPLFNAAIQTIILILILMLISSQDGKKKRD